MRFNDGDELLAMEVVREGIDVLVATEGGYAKRTRHRGIPGAGTRRQGRADGAVSRPRRGGLVGALVVDPDDELFAITSNGGVIRTTLARSDARSGRPWESS